MTSNGYTPFEIRVPLQKKYINSVHFRSDCVHDSLTVGGAVVEEDIQNRVVGKCLGRLMLGRVISCRSLKKGKMF